MLSWWVCEVLSPSTHRHDRVRKMPVYARAGVAFAWLVDPLERTVEAYRLEGGLWVRLGAWADDEVASIPPFEAVPLELRWLWSSTSKPEGG
jgi:Uma2 family endonuclease